MSSSLRLICSKIWLSCFGGCSFLGLMASFSPFLHWVVRMETQPSVCILRVSRPHNKFFKITLLGDSAFAFRHFNLLSWLSAQIQQSQFSVLGCGFMSVSSPSAWLKWHYFKVKAFLRDQLYCNSKLFLCKGWKLLGAISSLFHQPLFVWKSVV